MCSVDILQPETVLHTDPVLEFYRDDGSYVAINRTDLSLLLLFLLSWCFTSAETVWLEFIIRDGRKKGTGVE